MAEQINVLAHFFFIKEDVFWLAGIMLIHIFALISDFDPNLLKFGHFLK